MFPRWDLTWLLGWPFCLSFTFLWRLRAWSQLEMGHRLPESVLLYQTTSEDHIRLVKLTARCWVWEEFLSFLCRVEDCPHPSFIGVFSFREFPDLARAQHISLVPLQHAISPETWRNSNTEALACFGIYWYGPYGPSMYCKITRSSKKGDLVTQMVPSGTKFLCVLLRDLQWCP